MHWATFQRKLRDSSFNCFVTVHACLTQETIYWRSRSFSRKPICNFLLVTNCDLNLSRNVSEIQGHEIENHPTLVVWAPRSTARYWIRHQTSHAKSWDISLIFRENRWFFHFVTMHLCRRWRQMTADDNDRQHFMTIAVCNQRSTKKQCLSLFCCLLSVRRPLVAYCLYVLPSRQFVLAYWLRVC